MPDLYDDSMLLSEAEARLRLLQPRLEGPDQQAVDVLVGALHERGRKLDVARQVRAAQKEWFKTKADLPGCKALEAQLDRMLKE